MGGDGRERHPGVDEAGDGATDEGRALVDGDRMTESADHRADEDETLFRGAPEWCAGLDNDCEGAVVDGCLETTHEPRLAGPGTVDRFEVALGTRVEARVVVLAEEMTDMTFEWTADKRTFLGDTDASAVTRQSPEDSAINGARVPSFANLQAMVTDPEGRRHSVFGGVHLAARDPGAQASGGSAAGGGGLLAGRLFLFGRRLRFGALAAVLLLSLAAPVSAAELVGVTFPDSIQVSGKALPLKGLGLRKMLMIKVYVAGLYTSATGTADAIATSDDARAVVMSMKIGLSGERIGDSIEKGFERNAAGQMGTLRTRLDKLKSMFPSLEKGDTVTLAFDPSRGTVLSSAGKEIGIIEGKDFADALFKVWLGSDPVDDDLKDGMLGKS